MSLAKIVGYPANIQLELAELQNHDAFKPNCLQKREILQNSGN